MMLQLVRGKYGRVSTLGKLYVDGVMECYTLEDLVRPKGEAKVPGKTAIPAGTYPVELRKVGGFHQRYGKRFPKVHGGMLWVRDVPGFEYILIHCGNTHKHTEGCILVGRVPFEQAGEFTIGQSQDAYLEFYPKVLAALKRGEEVTLTITDEAA